MNRRMFCGGLIGLPAVALCNTDYVVPRPVYVGMDAASKHGDVTIVHTFHIDSRADRAEILRTIRSSLARPIPV